MSVFFSLPAFSLIHSIATRVIKLAQAKSSITLAPALVETYSRLLVYMEIESLGIKGFISESQQHSARRPRLSQGRRSLLPLDPRLTSIQFHP